MTQLVISVRDAREARIALRAGAELVDVKQPQRGSLGAPTRAELERVVREVDGLVPVSVALGELIERTPVENMLRDVDVLFTKVGLSGVNARWRRLWADWLESIPCGVQPVAVAYADWQTAGAPSITDVVDEAVKLGCPVFLVDTFEKRRGRLLDHMSLNAVRDLVGRVHAAGMRCVLAGSLDSESIKRVLRTEPDYIAVRGAVCTGGRTGTIDGSKIRRLVALIRSRDGSPWPRTL